MQQSVNEIDIDTLRPPVVVRKKLTAFCGSARCNARVVTRTVYQLRNCNKKIRKHVNRGTMFCLDCDEALFWVMV